MGTNTVESMQTQATVTLPLSLADVVNRIAAEQHWSFSEALLFLLKRGVKAQEESERAIEASHDRFMRATGTEEQEHTGNDLIRAIFGPESVA